MIAVFYPGSSIDNKEFVKHLIKLVYWPIYGEMTFREIAEHEEADFSAEKMFYGYVSTMIYVCLAKILLLNIVIAMFSNTFEEINKNSTELWKFNRLKLIYKYDEFYYKFPIPPPFSLISNCLQNLTLLFNCFLKNSNNEKTKKKQIKLEFPKVDEKLLGIFLIFKIYNFMFQFFFL